MASLIRKRSFMLRIITTGRGFASLRQLSTLQPTQSTLFRHEALQPLIYATRRNNSTAPSSATQAIVDPTTIQTVTDTIATTHQIGYFESVGLAQTWVWPSHIAEHILEYTHAYTGLPWWAVIVIVGAAGRLMLLPFTFKGNVMNMRMKEIKPETELLQKAMKAATTGPQRAQVALRRKKLMKLHNINTPVMFMSGLIQLPVAYGMFVGVSDMVKVPVDGMTIEGLLWFQDLTIPDPYLGLSVLAAVSTYCGVRFTETAAAPGYLKNAMMYGGTIGVMFMGLWYNAASVLYILTTSTVAFAVSMFMRTRAYRKLMNISESEYIRSKALGSVPSSGTSSFKEMWNSAKKEAKEKSERESPKPKNGTFKSSASLVPIKLKAQSKPRRKNQS
ncbi:60Kd inner membrane protein-domain-containing protein [Lipomyces arxii]|uniref:60Kd inner membrane protein-domain-containing protein n=1 Tax=Lipomyces arxii TaxID=56418 RepID=UPI0034CF83DB